MVVVKIVTLIVFSTVVFLTAWALARKIAKEWRSSDTRGLKPEAAHITPVWASAALLVILAAALLFGM